MEIYVNSGRPIAMAPCFYQLNMYIKRKLWGRRALKYNPSIGTKRVQTSTDLQITRFHVVPYRADMEIFSKFGATYRHGNQ